MPENRTHMEKSEKTKIYAFINGGSPVGYNVVAISKDGGLAGHLSSSEGWAKHDIGVESTWKHEIYNKKYPEGWEIEWVDDVPNHKELMELIEVLNAQPTEDQ